MAERERAISTAKKRRGIARASLTRLDTKLKELEDRSEPDPVVRLESVRQTKTKLASLDSDFRTHHFNLVDLLEERAELDAEQAVLDEQDGRVAGLSTRIECLINRLSTSPPSTRPVLTDSRGVTSRHLRQLERRLSTVNDTLSTDPTDECTVLQLEEEISDLKSELRSITPELASLDLPDDDELMKLERSMRESMYKCSLKAKRLLSAKPATVTTSTTDALGVKLPKIDVPRFNGNILSWRSFWEQFHVAIHCRTSLSKAEKLAYLQSSLKDGSAKSVIDGLSQSGDHYDEAVATLRARYDRPRLVHQTHVQMIVEAPGLKEGTGRELRRLHDTVQQHLRALRSMDYEPSGPFITSLLELKLDPTTMFEWQRASQGRTEVPPYSELLDFLDLRAQASEAKVTEPYKRSVKPEYRKTTPPVKPVHFLSTVGDSCVACNSGKHPLYSCHVFKLMPHDQMVSLLKTHNLCLNCFKSGHFIRQCPSLHRCRKCQGLHHTLLHTVTSGRQSDNDASTPPKLPPSTVSHVAMGLKDNTLLMTCRVKVKTPNGLSTEARGLLDSASSTSFVSERLAQRLGLPRTQQAARIAGVAGISHQSVCQSVTFFSVSSFHTHTKEIPVSAIIVPRVTCELPLHPVSLDSCWTHLSGLQLADPEFDQPGRVDLLLGVDVFVEVMMHGRRTGIPGSPVAFKTSLGWVLAGKPGHQIVSNHAVALHASVLSGDDVLQKFWEVEERVMSTPVMSAEERCVVKHFNESHSRAADGRFIVPLPRKPEPGVLGESRSSAVRRFLSLERSLHARGQFEEFSKVMSEYFEMEHAEEVPESSVNHPLPHTFYLPIHAVRKDSSTTTKLRAVFDASAKSSTGVSLNDLLLVGPTVHPSLVDVLIRFRTHRIALTTDVSRMYRAILLSESDKDLHRFVWREHKHKPLRDFRMTRITFGVSASSFIANMCVKQNAIDHAADYPLAFKAVIESFYVDDGLGGADTVQGAVRLQRELQSLFSCAGFLLRKWNSSDSMVLQHVPSELRDACATQEIHEADVYTKTLGIEWNAHGDYFRLAVGAMPHFDILTKRKLVSDVAKTFDVLGWFSPSIVPMKILLQRTWERKIDWDDTIPQDLYEVWEQWRAELRSLAGKCIPRCYYPEGTRPVSTQIHGFCDASEAAYAGVVYLRMTDTCNNTYTILVTSKTKVAPIRRLSIPRLELCGAYLLADLLHHVKEVLHLSSSAIYCWTDSTIVLHWLEGNPRRFKTYVGNRVSHIVGLIAPERWGHVEGLENPADCASRGLMPSELLNHELWWSGPNWLRLDPSTWPRRPKSKPDSTSEEVDELCLHTVAVQLDPVIPLDRYSTYTKLVRVTAWVIRFVLNCRAHQKGECRIASPLTVSELGKAKLYWILRVQRDHFSSEINTLKVGRQVSRSSPLKALNPFLDDSGLLRVGGREEHSRRSYDARHPLIVHAKHPMAKLLVRSEHERLLHAGPLLLATSLSSKFHIIRGRGLIRAITRNCVTCRRKSARPQLPIMGQMPPERVTPDIVFSRVGVDYAGPILIKLGAVRRPTIVKAYIAIFVSLTVKAVHLEAVSDLTADTFLACLRRFVARRGKPNLIWSDHGTNFVGANHQLAELYKFLRRRETEESITSLCSMQGIDWSFIPERAPHFGGLWEAAVKSTKRHLSRVVGSLKLTFEELCTVLSQIEACLNSRPLTSLPSDTDNIQVLTPGHFLIGRPLETLPDYPSSDRPISTLRRWELCQSMVRHFWRRWSSEYLTALQKLQKWHSPSRNMTVGDVVVLREDGMVPTRWPLVRITKTHPGRDSIVRVVTVKTSSGTYTRPVHKVVLLLPHDS